MNANKESEVKLKKGKYKRQKIKRIAANYLRNISLTGLPNEAQNCANFEALIANEFNCFLFFHKISPNRETQTDYFNFYKQAIQRNNRCHLKYFLDTEFNHFEVSINPNDFYKDYVENILVKKKFRKYTISKSIPITIPEIKIVPSLTFEDTQSTCLNDNYMNKIKLSLSDTENDFLQKKSVFNPLTSSNVTMTSQNSNTQKLAACTGLIQPIQTFKQKSRKSSGNSEQENLTKDHRQEPTEKLMIINEKSDLKSDYLTHSTNMYLNPKLSSNLKNEHRMRATSESSSESNLSSSINSHIMSRNFKMHRPTLFNNLRRLTNERIILTSSNIPISVFSRLAFRSNAFKSDLNDSFKYTIPKSSQTFISDVFDLFDLDFDEFIKKGEMSYEILIDPTVAQIKQRANTFKRMNPCDESRLKEVQSEDETSDDPTIKEDPIKKESLANVTQVYQPDYLDDPQLTELTAGKNRTCLKFSSYAVSIIDYVKPLDLKKEINETFKEKFPYIQISLTKLRSIKREMLEIGIECMLDLIIVAQSYVYFERLILQGLINKPNRKYLAANSLLIAAKLNDVTKKDITKLLDAIVTKFRIDNKREIISYEFSILVALEFNLMIKHEMDFISHYDRLKNNS